MCYSLYVRMCAWAHARVYVCVCMGICVYVYVQVYMCTCAIVCMPDGSLIDM